MHEVEFMHLPGCKPDGACSWGCPNASDAKPDYARPWDLDALAQPCRDCEAGEPHMCARMTEFEWRQQEARRECSTYGHDWSVIQTAAGVPVRLLCTRPCGIPGYMVTAASAAHLTTADQADGEVSGE